MLVPITQSSRAHAGMTNITPKTLLGIRPATLWGKACIPCNLMQVNPADWCHFFISNQVPYLVHILRPNYLDIILWSFVTLVISEIFCFNNKPVTIICKNHMLVPPQLEQSVEYIHRACSIEWPHRTTPSGRDQTMPSTFPMFFLFPLPENQPPVAAWVNMQPGATEKHSAAEKTGVTEN